MALSIDGTPQQAGSFSNAPLVLPAFSTSLTNDIVVVAVVQQHGPVTSITDTAGLTWAKRTSFFDGGVGNYDLWWALAASALTSDVITINNGGAAAYQQAFVLAVNGANLAAPWDINGVLPVSGTPDPLSISTTNANTIVFGLYAGATASPTAGTGFTQIGGTNFALMEYAIFSSPQSGLSVTVGVGAGGQTGVADAIQAPSSGPAWAQLSGGGGQHAMIRQVKVVGY